MPIYEYRRPDGSTFEVMQSFSDPPLKKDPETGVKVQRVLHAPAVHFKGKGFYNTDYGTKKRQRETAAAGEGGASENGASSAGGDGAGGKDGASAEGKGTSDAKSSREKGGAGASAAKDGAAGKGKSGSKPVAAAGKS
jgi:putative FmdB family regulatory protein